VGGDGFVSADGRYVVFSSGATNLVPEDTNGFWDVFVRDRHLGTTERVSVSGDGEQADTGGDDPAISADGRFVAFVSGARYLVPGDTNGLGDVFVHDRTSGATELVSIGAGGSLANDQCMGPSISDDGRFVAFWSAATDLVPGDTNGTYDVFVRDRRLGTTRRVSVATDGSQGNGGSGAPTISGDGRFVAFWSAASNLVPADTNACMDVFVRDLVSGATERVSVDSQARQANHASGESGISISPDGRFVAFATTATNFLRLDANGIASDVFVHDRVTGRTELASVDANGVQGDGASYGPALSGDGRRVAFSSFATNLVPGYTHPWGQVFVHDFRTGATERASESTSGIQGNSGSGGCAISRDGRFVAFDSSANNLISSDTNHEPDVFVHDRAASGFTSLCEPGVGGAPACPCANPPGGPGRGCENSSATGGAVLSATGAAYLSIDSLVFTTHGERSDAFSILLQAKAPLPNGTVFGQGVRCVGGPARRLFERSAVSGSIAVPDLGAGDPSVSARSAVLGDTIQPGQSRWYAVVYRDPIVLGGCPAGTTWNTTQTGRVEWSL
jgi:Tol biopolymer transport system component